MCSQRTRSADIGFSGGVGFKREPQLFLKPGDIVEVAVEGIGRLRNGVVDETGAA